MTFHFFISATVPAVFWNFFRFFFAVNASEAEEEDEHEFYDAINEYPGSPGSTGDNCITFNIPTGNSHRRHSSGSSSEVDEARETKHVGVHWIITQYSNVRTKNQPVHFQVVLVTEKARKTTHPEQPANNMLSKSSDSTRKRRTRIPDKPYYPLNLWGIMKNCIGKDLSKIPMPVNFSEPLSMLQRLTEDYEYADILDVAAKWGQFLICRLIVILVFFLKVYWSLRAACLRCSLHYFILFYDCY